MCIMVARRQDEGEAFTNHTPVPLQAEENNAVLSMGYELALAGDELTRRFSEQNEVDEEGLWDNVRRFAFIMAFRLIFALVWL